MSNKWTRAAIPALLIHCSIGTVYCWSTFKEAIATQIDMSTFSVGWAFSLAIFFLGMSAAFAGKYVEADIGKSSAISCICFSLGLLGTGISIQNLKGVPALVCIYLFYGCIMGIGLGVGYITPVKTLMLWFNDKKGLATGISIMGFGLAKAIATPFMEYMQSKFGICDMFYSMSLIYLIFMWIAHILIEKPSWWKEPSICKESNFSVMKLLSDKKFIYIWLMFYINIHCGLMLISYEKQLLKFVGTALPSIGVLVAVVPSVTSLCNAFGRLGYSALSDKLKNRVYVYRAIFISCIVVSAPASYFLHMFPSVVYITVSIISVILLLCVVNLGYGGGFSTLPALLSQEFGMEDISKIHGIALTAWAVAGITGNNLSAIILSTCNNSYAIIFSVTCLLYIIAYSVSRKVGYDSIYLYSRKT